MRLLLRRLRQRSPQLSGRCRLLPSAVRAVLRPCRLKQRALALRHRVKQLRSEQVRLTRTPHTLGLAAVLGRPTTVDPRRTTGDPTANRSPPQPDCSGAVDRRPGAHVKRDAEVHEGLGVALRCGLPVEAHCARCVLRGVRRAAAVLRPRRLVRVERGPCIELSKVAARCGAQLEPCEAERRVTRGAATVAAAEREVAHGLRVAGLRRSLVVLRSERLTGTSTGITGARGGRATA
eukprot:scaffold66645_cov60-Phaeocystis_antarctica.AAC.4